MTEEKSVSETFIEKATKGNEKVKSANSPPRAPLVLRIGVTGHRTEPPEVSEDKRKRPIPDEFLIRNTINEILQVIKVSFKGVADTSGSLFELQVNEDNSFGGGTLRIISALASGADQWVVEEARKLDYELQAILPFDRTEYAHDFTSVEASVYWSLLKQASAVLELDGKVEQDDALCEGNTKNGKHEECKSCKTAETGRNCKVGLKTRKPDNRSYEAVGRAVLNQTDILLAVWDGKGAHGRGGTGQVVREALQKGIPVIHIPWSPAEKWVLHNPSWRLMEEAADMNGDNDRLSELIGKLLLPPAESSPSELESEKSLRKEYFREGLKLGNPHLGWWMFFRNLICGELFAKSEKGFFNKLINLFRVENFTKSEERKAAEFWRRKNGESPEENEIIDKEMQNWINERFTGHYAWANGLSMFYGEMHRSAVLVNYLLGATAVFLALVCIAAGISGKLQAGWIVAELLVITGILVLTGRGRRRRWHQRWIDYRTLAEYLRLSRCMILLGGGSPQVMFEGPLGSYGNPSQTWMNWHRRAVERAAGIPDCIFTGNYLASCQEIWRDPLVKGQMNYHRAAFKRMKKLDRRLHKTGDFLFIATLIACGVHLAHLWLEADPRFSWIPGSTGNWMTLLCAFLPALGAAFAAIRNHLEIQRLAQRSRAMLDTLTNFQADLAKVPVQEKALNSILLRNHADRICDLMTNEMLDWRVVFQDRPLVLPA